MQDKFKLILSKFIMYTNKLTQTENNMRNTSICIVTPTPSDPLGSDPDERLSVK